MAGETSHWAARWQGKVSLIKPRDCYPPAAFVGVTLTDTRIDMAWTWLTRLFGCSHADSSVVQSSRMEIVNLETVGDLSRFDRTLGVETCCRPVAQGLNFQWLSAWLPCPEAVLPRMQVLLLLSHPTLGSLLQFLPPENPNAFSHPRSFRHHFKHPAPDHQLILFILVDRYHSFVPICSHIFVCLNRVVRRRLCMLGQCHLPH